MSAGTYDAKAIESVSTLNTRCYSCLGEAITLHAHHAASVEVSLVDRRSQLLLCGVRNTCAMLKSKKSRTRIYIS